MARIGESGDLLKCSFCGKSQKQVQKLIAGPGVYICEECVVLCCELCEEEGLDLAHKFRRRSEGEIPLSYWIESAERRETIKLVSEAKTTLEQLLKLLDLQHSNKES